MQVSFKHSPRRLMQCCLRFHAGLNDYFRLGASDSFSSNVPLIVSGRLEFVQVAAGWWHTCGILQNGSAVCWGAFFFLESPNFLPVWLL